MARTEKMVCPRCGVEMNHHAMKVDYTARLDNPAAIDPVFGGVLQEANVKGADYRVDYEPAESSTGLFGGNSNWRGPIWFPVNFLLVESLQKFHHYLGDDFKVECPTGSGNMLTLWEVAAEISRRLSRPFLRAADGHRPVYGEIEKFQTACWCFRASRAEIARSKFPPTRLIWTSCWATR